MVNLAIKVFFLCSFCVCKVCVHNYLLAWTTARKSSSLLTIFNYLSINMEGLKNVSVATLYMAFFAILLAVLTVPAATASYVNWTTFFATGVNLGGWLEQESTIDSHSGPSTAAMQPINGLYVHNWRLNVPLFSLNVIQHSSLPLTSTPLQQMVLLFLVSQTDQSSGIPAVPR